jgi:EmrB/QacA subfamily drug resistance transporter
MSEDPIEPPPEPPASVSSGATTRDWVVPAIIGSALLMQTLNATVITNALPAMAGTFGVEPLRLNIAITVYLLAGAVFLPVSGWLADRFGARRVFLSAIALYSLGSLACGFSETPWQLMGARVLQGAAGSALLPVGRLILLRTTPKNELIGAFSVVTMPALLGPVLGPVVGGAIVTFAEWPWIFFMNLPIGAAGLLLVYRFVPEVREIETPPVDLLGIPLTGLGLAALIFGFENLGRNTIPPFGVGALFAGGLAALLLYAWHAGRTRHAAVDLSIFRVKTFSAAVIGGGFVRVAMGADPFLLAMLLQVSFGLSAFVAGAMTCISALGALLMKATAPPLLRRFGFRTVLSVNAAIVALSFMAYALFRPDWPHWVIAVVLGVGGFFRSLQFTALNGMAFADIEQDRMSRAATTSSMAQPLVQAIGIGLSASLFQVLMQLRGESRLTVEAGAPVFVIMGVLTLVSLFWFMRLPDDAGDEMNRRVRA